MHLFKLWFSPDMCLAVGLLDYMVVPFLFFWETSILFSIVVVPVYISSISEGGFPFLHALSSILICRLLMIAILIGVSSFFSVLSFCLFILFMGFSRQEYWSGLPFLSPVGYILSELCIMTCFSWVALQGMAHIFIELDKAVVYVIRLVIFLWLWL